MCFAFKPKNHIYINDITAINNSDTSSSEFLVFEHISKHKILHMKMAFDTRTLTERYIK